MKQVQLLSLELTNFKGIKSFKLEADGGNIKVFGDNATGKTTIADAWAWVLFEKDSEDKKEFAIKTLVNGEEVHNIENSVEAVMLVDGEEIKLRKVQFENWVKPKGRATSEFTGNKVKNYINDVPIKTQREYKERIAEIIDEETFKLITSPTFFNEKMTWQNQRKRLIKICGDVSDEEVITSKSELAELPAIIKNRTPEETKKMIIEKQREINTELKTIPSLINENHNMKPEMMADVEALKIQVNQLESDIDQLKSQKLNVQNGAAVLEKRKQLQEIEMQLADLKRNYEADSKQEVYKMQARVQECQGNLQIVQSKLAQNIILVQMKQREMNSLTDQINDYENRLSTLRANWTEVNEKQLTYEDKCECPSCNQPLPIEQVQKAREEALAKFNTERSSKLQEIDATGKKIKSEKVSLLTQHNDLNNEVFHYNTTCESIKREIEQKQKELEKAQQQLEKAENSVPDVTTSEEYKSLISQKEAVLAEIEQLERRAYEVAYDIDKNINDLVAQKQSINAQLAQFANIEFIDKRIKELEEKEVNLGKELEKLEKHIFIIDEFIRTKVKMLDDRINSKFKYARFKLFNELQNGGLEETCVATFNGVPYGTGLNNAAKINIGLDIINTLSVHHGITAPIFIDNAESVTKFIDTNAQLISLIVSEKDKQLRVETDLIEFKEAI